MTTLSVPELAAYARSAGWTGDGLITIVAIALRESGGNPAAIGDIDNPHRGCRSYGLVQINVCPQGTAGGNNKGTPWRENPTTLLDPVTNFTAAYQMSRGGQDFGPWTTYRAGIPAPDIARVKAEIGAGGGTVAGPTIAGSSSSSSSAPDIFARLTSWETWRSVIYVVGGLGFIGLGLLILNRDRIGSALGGATGAGAPSDPDDTTDAPAATAAATAATIGA